MTNEPLYNHLVSRQHSFFGFWTFSASGTFLPVQDCNCSGVVINNDLGVYVACLLLHAPLIPVLPSEQASTTHPTSLMRSQGKAGNISQRPVWENQDIHNASLPKDNSIQIETIWHISFMTANWKKYSFLFVWAKAVAKDKNWTKKIWIESKLVEFFQLKWLSCETIWVYRPIYAWFNALCN